MDDLMKLGKAFSVQEQEANSAAIEQERIRQEQAAEAEREKLRNSTSLGELIESSLSLNNFTYQTATEDGARWAGESDPNFFKSIKDIQKDLEERKVPIEYLPRLTEADSQQRYDAILGKIGGEMQHRQVEGAHPPWLTIPIGVATTAADPFALGAAAVIPEVALPAKAVGVGKVLQGAVRGAAAFGAGTAAVSIPQYGMMETKTGAEVALEIAGGSVLGAIAGGAKGAYGAWMDKRISETKAALFNTITKSLHKAPADVAQWIDKYSAQHGVSSDLAYAVAYQESRFNKDAKGKYIEKKKDNAVGVFQLMKDAETDLKIDRYNPEQNVEGGIRYLSQQLKRYNGDEEKALAAYNWGMKNVDTAVKKYGDKWKEHLPKETSDYIRKITGQASVTRKSSDTVRAFLEENNAAFGEPAKETPKLNKPRYIAHGTSKANKQAIIASGKFELIDANRHYSYSELGADTMYFTSTDGWWLDTAKAKESRSVEYEDKVFAEVSPDANFVTLNSPEDAEAFAKRLGYDSWSDMPFFVDGMKDGEIPAARAREYYAPLKAKLEEQGIDGLVISKDFKSSPETGFDYPAPDQVAVFNLSKVKPVADEAKVFGEGTAGAAQVDGTYIAKAIDETSVEDMPEAFAGKWRFDAVGQLKSDENPFLRRLSQMAEDNVGLNKDGSASIYSAEEHANHLIHTTGAQWFRGYGSAFDEFAEGIHAVGRGEKLATFNDEVMRTVLTGTKHSNQAVNKAAAETVAYFKRFADEGFSSGSKYFEGVMPDAKYLPRIINPEKWEMMLAKHNYSDVVKLVREAFIRQLDDAADPAMQKLADKLAQGYVSNVSNRGAIGSTRSLHGIDLEDADSLIPLLKEQGLGDGEIQEVLDGLTQKSTDKAAPSRLKRRVDFDMTTALHTPDGELRMVDLFETDLPTLIKSYGEQVAGYIGMAKIGIKSEADYKKLLENAAVWNAQNKGGANKNSFNAQLGRAEFLYKAVTRQQLDSTISMGADKALRHIRSFNVMRLMNNTGFAQLAEFGNILGRGGVDAMTELIPAFKTLIKDRGKYGRKLDKGIYEEMEAVAGIGTSELLGRHYLGFDSMEGAFSSMDKVMHNGKRITSHLSGMAYLMPAMQRMAAGAMTHRFAKFALKEKLTETQMRELRQLGLDDVMMQRVLSQVKQHATIKRKKITALNIEKWGIEEQAHFGLALQRATRRMVQENSIGGSMPVEHTWWGKLLFQFKRFVMGAWTKQTLAGAALHDMRTFVSWAVTSLIGALAYIAQTHLMHYGDDDKLDEKLTYEKIGAASFARAGWSSLVPTAVDTTLPLLTGGYSKQVFSDTRASGQKSDIVKGSPAYTLITTLGSVAPNLWMPILVDDYNLTEGDAKKIVGLMPFVQAMGIRRQLEVVIEDAGLSKKRFNSADQIDPLEEISDILSSN